MRASVLFEQGKPLSIEELELEPPRAGEVLVRMAARASVIPACTPPRLGLTLCRSLSSFTAGESG